MGSRKTVAQQDYEKKVERARAEGLPAPESWEHPKGWEPNNLVSAINSARRAGDSAEAWSFGELQMEHGERWGNFTPEARDRYVELIDEAVTALRRVRAALIARDWRTCEGCGVEFVGVEGQRFHSVACKQRAYRARRRLAEPPVEGVCGCCRGTGLAPIAVTFAANPPAAIALGFPGDGRTFCPVCQGSGRVDAEG